MKQHTSFKEVNLSVDYLTLSIADGSGRISEFSEIFRRHGFSSEVVPVDRGITNDFFQEESLSYTVRFVIDREWQKNTVLAQFSSKNRRRLYFLIKIGKFSTLELGSNDIKLGRVDVRYCRKNTVNDMNIDEFFKKLKKIRQTLMFGQKRVAGSKRLLWAIVEMVIT